MRVTTAALFAVSALSLVAACKKEDERDPCLQPSSTVLYVRTQRRADTGTATLDTLLRAPVAWPLTGGAKQYIYYPGQRTYRFALSLSQVADSSRWALQPDTAAGTLIDTLTFYYDRQLRFLSNSCGYTTFYNLKSVRTTTHAIDSVILQNPSISTNVNIDNIRIYY